MSDTATPITITSLRIEFLGGHAHFHVWWRHQKSGTLVVDRGDALAMVTTLVRDDRVVVTIVEDGVERDFWKDVDDAAWSALRFSGRMRSGRVILEPRE